MIVTRDDRRWFGLGFGLGWLLVGLLFAWVLTSSCTSTQRQTFKSHALETGIAAAGGALAVVIAGPAGIPIFIGGMATAAFVGEIEKPPPQETHTTTVVSPDGKILSQKTTTSAQKVAPSAMELLTPRNLIILALMLIALLFPGARALAVQALSAALQAAKAAPAWIGSHLKSLRTQKRPERRP